MSFLKYYFFYIIIVDTPGILSKKKYKQHLSLISLFSSQQKTQRPNAKP